MHRVKMEFGAFANYAIGENETGPGIGGSARFFDDDLALIQLSEDLDVEVSVSDVECLCLSIQHKCRARIRVPPLRSPNPHGG
jgi:hypothetical protein